MRKQASLAQYTLSGVKAKKANEGRVDMKQPVIYCDCNGWWRVGCKEAIVTQRADHVPGYLFLDGNKLLRPTGTSLLQALNQGAWISHTNMAVEVFGRRHLSGMFCFAVPKCNTCIILVHPGRVGFRLILPLSGTAVTIRLAKRAAQAIQRASQYAAGDSKWKPLG